MTDHVRPPTPRTVRIAWFVAAVAVIMVAGFIIYLAVWGSGESQQKDQAQVAQQQEQQGKKDLAAEVDRICATKTPEAASLRSRGKCEQAKEIIKEPTAGAKGDPGSDGPKGDKGDKGDPGASPPCLLQANRCVGSTGAVGPIGVQGIQGIPGVKGDTGATGAKGDTGDQGITGEKGANGDKGDIGDKGIPGVKGDTGDKGDTGAPGPACPTGYHLEVRHVVSTEAPTGEVSQVCIQDAEQP